MTDFMDDGGFTLDRMRKLAGVPAGQIGDAPVVEPTADFEAPAMVGADLGGDDLDGEFDAGLDGIEAGLGDPLDHPLDPAAELPVPSDIDVPALNGAVEPAMSHWEDTLAQLEHQLNDIPVGDFKAVIDSLHRVANYADDIRRSLVTEGRKTFRDYLNEVEAIGTIKPQGANSGQQTLGGNMNDAVKAIHARLGGKPQDTQKARQTFDALRKGGSIKPQGAGFTMQTMDDQEFNDAISAPNVP